MQSLLRDVPVLRATDPVHDALRALLDHDLPALPVVDAGGQYVGVFGEREFIAALFPAYLGTMSYAGFVPEALDEVLEQRSSCVSEPIGAHMNREHVDLPVDASNASVAETFLHHRVLIVPVTDGTQVVGIVRRADFFRALAGRALGA